MAKSQFLENMTLRMEKFRIPGKKYLPSEDTWVESPLLTTARYGTGAANTSEIGGGYLELDKDACPI
ncbi:unnamed protein product [Hymenolepis diminuta]|uniref:METMALONYL_COA_MUTASE domain-containing protein n=1 Tax=Hymenolepis diminuta TaxID=6216 RepID=A0A0R3SHB7_HYMDI|nr:unnamed protein product [Hymenolepis diminuta]